MAEESKVAIRAIRRDGIDKAKAMQKNSEITEDDLRGAEDKVQKLTDKKIEEIAEILNITEKNVGVRVNRARNILINKMREAAHE